MNTLYYYCYMALAAALKCVPMRSKEKLKLRLEKLAELEKLCIGNASGIEISTCLTRMRKHEKNSPSAQTIRK